MNIQAVKRNGELIEVVFVNENQEVTSKSLQGVNITRTINNHVKIEIILDTIPNEIEKLVIW